MDNCSWAFSQQPIWTFDFCSCKIFNPAMISVLQNWDLGIFWKLLLYTTVIPTSISSQNSRQIFMWQSWWTKARTCSLRWVTKITFAICSSFSAKSLLDPPSSHEPQPSTDIMKAGHSHSWRLMKQRKATSSYNPHHLAFSFVHVKHENQDENCCHD